MWPLFPGKELVRDKNVALHLSQSHSHPKQSPQVTTTRLLIPLFLDYFKGNSLPQS